MNHPVNFDYLRQVYLKFVTTVRMQAVVIDRILASE
jgi:hypothetical protein